MTKNNQRRGFISRKRRDLSRAWQTPNWRRQGERFGTGVALAGAVMSGLAMYRGDMARMQALALVSASLLFLSFVAPRLLYPPAWMLEQTFVAMTKALMYLLLVLVFYLVFAPAGIALRIMGKDVLRKNMDKQAPTYWSECKKHDASRVEKQF